MQVKSKLTLNTIINFCHFSLNSILTKYVFTVFCLCTVQWKNSERKREKEKRRVGREARQYSMIPSVSTADWIQSFHWCMETCAGHVCLSGHCTIRKIQRGREKQPVQRQQTHPHLWEPTGPRVCLLREPRSVGSISVCSIWFTDRPLSSDNGSGSLNI